MPRKENLWRFSRIVTSYAKSTRGVGSSESEYRKDRAIAGAGFHRLSIMACRSHAACPDLEAVVNSIGTGGDTLRGARPADLGAPTCLRYHETRLGTRTGFYQPTLRGIESTPGPGDCDAPALYRSRNKKELHWRKIKGQDSCSGPKNCFISMVRRRGLEPLRDCSR